MDLLKAGALATKKGGGATNVEDVFSTYLFNDSNNASSPVSVVNGIDLSGEGGLVWVKSRTSTQPHSLTDTVRGTSSRLSSDSAAAEYTGSWDKVNQFNSDGFRYANGYAAAQDYVSWTFRKAPKFFDVVTYTGDGTSSRQINHDLGATPALLMVKATSATGDWNTIARISDTSYSFGLELNTTKVQSVATGPSSTVSSTWFVPEYFTGSVSEMNASGTTYVAYLFADNTAEDVDDQMIKCGSFTTNSSGGATVNLGWQPQFLMFKIASGTADSWYMFDTMRDFTVSKSSALFANTSAPDASSNGNTKVTSNGFDISNQQNSVTYIYMAVRAPMMAEPEAATDVFAVDNVTTSTPKAISNFPIDFSLTTSGTHYTVSRLMGTNVMATNSTGAQFDWGGGNPSLDYMDGFSMSADMNGYLTHMWKRAKGFFDVVAYTGDGVSGRTVAHSLGVAPEMIWVKSRSDAYNWLVMPNDATKYAYLNYPNGASVNSAFWLDTDPTSTEFTVSANAQVNGSAKTYIAYLFASLAGISKVGNYTGNGSSQTINCGFAAGARFILIKRTDATGDWYVWDSARGITAGNDPHLSLNTTAAQVTTDDSVDPENSGFIVNQNSATNINVTSSTYIFYAIA